MRLPRARAITEAAAIAGIVGAMLLASGHVVQPNQPTDSATPLTPLQREASSLQAQVLEAQATFEALGAQAVTAPGELAALGAAHSHELTTRLTAIETERQDLARRLVALRAQLAAVQAQVKREAPSPSAG